MKKYLFLGAKRTGKTTNMILLAKILAKLKKKVLVVDTSFDQGIKSFFCFNSDIESLNPLEDSKTIIRDDFEIVFGQQYKTFDINRLKEYNLEKYDYVFYEGDINVPMDLIHSAERVFLFQDGDKAALYENKDILGKINIEENKIIIVFNSMLNIEYGPMYLLSELVKYIKIKDLSKVNENIEILFDERNLGIIQEGKMNGKIDLKKLTDEYKGALFDFINIIEKVDIKNFKKIAK
ncbi:hypothetical protein IAI10_16285 [Clostridium sp. 19966]|uniref:hypothetical protein n=1 Tax=Clostridium sp. 19966 TaxID=2768166 RepID=UPI0028DE0E4A|nr:hypothetical protein [Clostridium sp. 19966]MDT8718226.1 hypothetical protein [Clostridium sp. 19966]